MLKKKNVIGLDSFISKLNSIHVRFGLEEHLTQPDPDCKVYAYDFEFDPLPSSVDVAYTSILCESETLLYDHQT